MKTVLLITYYFPPRWGIGSVRPSGLYKQLPEFGWDVLVLTPSIFGHTEVRPGVITTPYNDVVGNWKKVFGYPRDTVLHKVWNISPSQLKKRSFPEKIIDFTLKSLWCLVAYPDAERGWYRYGVESARDLINTRKIDAIISTSSPPTTHLIAHRLKNEFNIPWIAEFRDLWTQNPYYPCGRFRKHFEARLERKIIQPSDALVSVSQHLVNKLTILHGNKTTGIIPNGFEPELWIEKHPPLEEKLVMTHTGSLYDGKRNPEYLFKAIKILSNQGISFPDILEIKFLGPREDWLDDQIARYGINNMVRQFGKVTRATSLSQQRKSQVLLLISGPDEKGGLPAKMYEYLAAQRPIVAIGGEHGKMDIGTILSETSTGYYCTNLEETITILDKLFREYKTEGKISYLGKKVMVLKYSHIEMARKYANLLSQITK